MTFIGLVPIRYPLIICFGCFKVFCLDDFEGDAFKKQVKKKDDSLPALGPPQCNYHRVIKQGLLEKPPLGSMLCISAPISTEFPWFSHRHVLIAGDLRPAISARLDKYEAHADERNKDAFKVSLAASFGKSTCLRWIIIHTWARAASPADCDRFLWGKCWGKWGQHLCKPWSWLKLTSLTYWNYCCESFPFSVSVCCFKEARWFCTLSVSHCVRI